MQPAETDEITPASAAELARFLSENAHDRKQPVIPAGGRTTLRIGAPVDPHARIIATSSLNRVIDYPARDMTITVEAGIRVSELQKILSAERQRLPIDIPDARRATLGGAIATNTSGPGRFGHGTFRDFVIGISAIDGQGRPFSAGGRVVKNVAGYDLCKLLVGSMGTLAVITQVTLKVRPICESRRIAWRHSRSIDDIETALERLTHSATRPAAIELLNAKAARAIRAESKIELPGDGWLLFIAYEGSERESEWQVAELARELPATGSFQAGDLSDTDASSVWEGLVEFQAASDDPATFVAAILPSAVSEFVRAADELGAAVQAHAGNGVVVGHLPDRCVDAAMFQNMIRQLRERAATSGGSLVVWNCEESWKAPETVFDTSLSRQPWMRQVKAALDPHNLLSPGRLPL